MIGGPAMDSVALIRQLEELAAQHEARATLWRTAAEALRKAAELPELAAELSAPAVALEVPRALEAPATRARGGRKPAGQHAATLEKVYKAVAYFAAPCKAAQIRGRLGADSTYNHLRRYLNELVKAKRLTRIGTRSLARYTVRPAPGTPPKWGPASSTPAAASRPAAPKTEDAATRRHREEGEEARAGLLPRVLELLADGGLLTFGQIRKITGAPKSTLSVIIRQLRETGRITTSGIAMDAPYRLVPAAERQAPPPVRTVPIPAAPDRAAVSHKIGQLLASGITYDVHDLVRNCRPTFPGITDAMIEAEIAERVRLGQVLAVPIGSRARYRAASADFRARA